MKITKLILAAYLLMSMAACDTDKNIAVYGEDSGAIQIEAAINTAFTRSNPGAAGEQSVNLGAAVAQLMIPRLLPLGGQVEVFLL